MKVLLTDETIKKAHEQYSRFTADEQMQRIYDARWKDMLDRNSLFETGRRDGMKEGIEKGKIEDAQRMLAEGFGVDIISKITGLKEEEIKKL